MIMLYWDKLIVLVLLMAIFNRFAIKFEKNSDDNFYVKMNFFKLFYIKLSRRFPFSIDLVFKLDSRDININQQFKADQNTENCLIFIYLYL